MERVSLNCSCLLLGDYRTSPRSICISERGWSIDVNSVDSRCSVDLQITQADILKIFAFLGKEKSYIFINLNEKKCLKIQNDLRMANSNYRLDIRSKTEGQRRVIIVLDDVVEVCHNILRQRFKFFHELRDRAAAENLFKFASKTGSPGPTRSPPKRKMDMRSLPDEGAAGPSKIPKLMSNRQEFNRNYIKPTSSKAADDYTSDLSFEISKKQITNQALSMELDLKMKKQDILKLRGNYYVEKEQIDNDVKKFESRIDKKEEEIRKDAFPKINSEIRHLERRLQDLKDQKKDHLEELQSYNDSLSKVSNRKSGLKTKYLEHIKLEHTRLTEIKGNLAKLKGAEVLLNNKDNTVDNIAKYESLSAQIGKYERKLECPVCLDTCQPPIYQCHESHIICKECRDRVKKCPQCLISFQKKRQRHRYAEEDAEELRKLYKERETVFNNIHEREKTK